jgi:hypothetical protein
LYLKRIKKEFNLWVLKDLSLKFYCNISNKEMLKLIWTARKHQGAKRFLWQAYQMTMMKKMMKILMLNKEMMMKVEVQMKKNLVLNQNKVIRKIKVKTNQKKKIRLIDLYHNFYNL